jgi:hypothetical protein
VRQGALRRLAGVDGAASATMVQRGEPRLATEALEHPVESRHLSTVRLHFAQRSRAVSFLRSPRMIGAVRSGDAVHLCHLCVERGDPAGGHAGIDRGRRVRRHPGQRPREREADRPGNESPFVTRYLGVDPWVAVA